VSKRDASKLALCLLAIVASGGCKIGEGAFSLEGKYSEKRPGEHIKRAHLHGNGEVKVDPKTGLVTITGADKDTDIELVDDVVGPGGESALDIAGVGSVTVSPGPR
jgi:hypothetical protein